MRPSSLHRSRLFHVEKVSGSLRPVSRNSGEEFHVNAMRHAHLARQLIAACSGLHEAASACRLGKSRLAEFQDPESGAFMPADVIFKLEEYCGRPIYSQALVDARPSAVEARNVLTEACEISEGAGALLRVARMAAEDGALNAEERSAIEAGAQEIERQLSELRAAASRGAAT